MIHIDGCRTPPRTQAVRQRVTSVIAAPLPWYHKLWKMLAQKGDPTLIKCAYCQKEVPEEKAIESEIVYLQGPNVARKVKKYCSTRCASYDQMAHEP